MCRLMHSLEGMRSFVKHPASLHQTELSSEWGSATRGTVDPRPGRLRQWDPLPRMPRPCANPVRASAPSRREGHCGSCVPPLLPTELHSFHNWSYPHLLGAGSPKGGMPNARGERQEAGSCEPADCRRRRASLYQPMVLRIANKAAAAVLLSVNRAG